MGSLVPPHPPSPSRISLVTVTILSLSRPNVLAAIQRPCLALPPCPMPPAVPHLSFVLLPKWIPVPLISSVLLPSSEG
eukprot:scaffold198855_cov29-Tisochrysis_lutea.AAC.3